MTVLHEQIVAYESMQQSLELNHFGKWVVFHDKAQSGVHDSLESAAQSAVSKFGDDPYLIREIGAAPVTLPVSVLYPQMLNTHQDNQLECRFVGRHELLVQMGPSIAVQIGLDENALAGAPENSDLPNNHLHALIDTKTLESCIDSTVAASLKLPIIDERAVAGVYGLGKVNVHLAQIQIPFLNIKQYGAFCGIHLQADEQPHSALFGRMFLDKLSQLHNGRTGSVSLIFKEYHLTT